MILLGKYGDCVNALPIIEHEFKKTGKKQDVITSDKFSSVFHGVTYVKRAIIYPGKWADLHGAIKFAKGIFNEVVILQCHGENFPFKQTRLSFQHEVYDRAGLLGLWPTMRPNFDRRDYGREKTLMEGHGLLDGKKYILIADHSESSQFKQIEELKVMLNTKFGNEYKIVLLSSIKAHAIYDLLAVYERASAIVATESVHTHLAWATNVPMFVLSADGWRGSAFRKQFKFYAKYSDWERRKQDLISALQKFLSNGDSTEPLIFSFEKPFGYNLSSIEFDGKGFHFYRHHSGNWKTKIQIYVDGKEFPLKVDEKIENHSIEDLRAFQFNGKLHGVYTVAAEINGNWKCYQAYGEITNEGGQWRIGHIQIKYPGNDFNGTTKNFCPFVQDDVLHFIWGISGASQVVLEMDHDRVRKAHHSPAPRWEHGEIRGGIVIPKDDTFLRFFHSRAEYPDKTFRYFVGCALMERKSPFRTLKICKAPVLQGDDEYIHGCRHWKGSVVFPLGAIDRADKILLSYGKNDCECRILELAENDLNL